MSEEFEYVSSSSGEAINELNGPPFEQELNAPFNDQPTDYQPNSDWPINDQAPGNPVLKVSTRDKMVRYLTDASAYLNGKPFSEQGKSKLALDNQLLLLDLAEVPTSEEEYRIDESIVLDTTWTFVVTLMNSLNTNLTALMDYYDSLSIGEETRNQLLHDNHWLINAMLDTPLRLIAGHKLSKRSEPKKLDKPDKPEPSVFDNLNGRKWLSF